MANFNEGLTSVSDLTNSAFTVKKTSNGRFEEDQALSGTSTVSEKTVTPTLSSAVIASDMGKVSYTAPTEPSDKLRDAAGNNVVNFMDPKVFNICSRSEVVRDAILELIPGTELCDEVTSNDLGNIISLNLSQMDITQLQSGDFNGLTNLQELDLGDNALTDLHQDLFDGLTNLRQLSLDKNSLTSLHQDLFDGLTSIQTLDLSGNAFTSLHQDLFDGLTSLEILWLHNNAFTGLHQDLFDGLTNLKTLGLGGNSLADLHQDLFDGLTNLQILDLYNNALTDLHPDLFDDVEASLEVILSNNLLTCVPAEILNQGNVTITPPSIGVVCPEPSVELSLNPSTIGEEDAATQITVTGTLNVLRSTATPVTVSVGSGTATSGTDFAEVSDFTISIPSDNLSATGTFTLTPTSDTVDESDETVIITGTSTVDDVTVTGTSLTIIDDDVTLTLTLNLSSTSISENAGSTSVTAILDQPAREETTITVSVDPTSPATDSDYTLSGSTLTIAQGETESTETVTITTVDNDVVAPDKIVTVQGTSNNQGIIDPADVELTITDDDVALTVTLNLSSTSISENAGSTSVTAILDQPAREETTITVSVDPTSPATDSDYTLSGSTLTIAQGETESTETVTITAVDNDVVAPDKIVTVQGTSNNQGIIDPADVELTITDDDVALTVTLNLSSTSISENAGSTSVTAILDQPAREETTITVSVDPTSPATASDYTLSGSTLTIAEGATESTGRVTITAVDNDVVAPDKIVTVQGTSNNQGIIDPTDVELTITDDDMELTVTLNLSSSSISENEASTTVTATLSHASTETTTITVTVLPDSPATESDVTLTGNTLTIAAGETESTGEVTITSVDNPVDAPDKTVQVQGTAENTQGVTGPSAVELAIIDDEEASTVTLMLDPSTINENGGRTTVTAILSHPSSDMTTVVISTLANPPAMASDLMLGQNTILTVAAGETSSTGLVTLTAVDNEVDAPDKTVQVQGTATNEQGIIDPADVELTITDDEAAPAVMLMVDPSTIAENGGTTTVTATLNRASDEETSIAVSVLPNAPATASDYLLSDNLTLTIAAGELTSTGFVTITAVDNEVDAPDKAVQVQGRSTNAQGVTDPEDVTLTITDDDTSTSAQVPTELPAVFTLHGNYPNPFNPSTRIQFDLPERAQVMLQVVDMLGRKVMEYPAQAFDAGANRTIELNATQLVSGTYLYRMIAIGSETKYQKTGRMMLMK